MPENIAGYLLLLVFGASGSTPTPTIQKKSTFMKERVILGRMRILVANIPLRRNRFLQDLNTAIASRSELRQSSDDFWAMKGDYDVVHLHWPEYITADIEAAYNSALDEGLIAALEERMRFWASRSAIVVTRHNPFPYNAPDSTAWARVYRLIFSHADGVVHMGQASIDHFREQYRGMTSSRGDDLRHTIIPIQNYASLPNDISRPLARERLGIARDAEVVLVFGAIRTDAERGLILKTFRLLPNRRKVLLVSSWRERWPKTPSTRLSGLVRRGTRLYHKLHSRYYFNYGFVDESDAQLFVNASDVLFIPRLQVLNSANLSLGMTFGRVVVGPDLGNVGELLRQTGNPVFDPRDPQRAATAVAEGLRLAEAGELGAQNQRLAMSDWSADRCAVQYVEFFREVAAATSASI